MIQVNDADDKNKGVVYHYPQLLKKFCLLVSSCFVQTRERSKVPQTKEVADTSPLDDLASLGLCLHDEWILAFSFFACIHAQK